MCINHNIISSKISFWQPFYTSPISHRYTFNSLIDLLEIQDTGCMLSYCEDNLFVCRWFGHKSLTENLGTPLHSVLLYSNYKFLLASNIRHCKTYLNKSKDSNVHVLYDHLWYCKSGYCPGDKYLQDFKYQQI